MVRRNPRITPGPRHLRVRWIASITSDTPGIGVGSPWAGIVGGRAVRGIESEGPPVVAGIPGRLLRDDDRIRIDGSLGHVDLPDVREFPVVTVFLVRRDRQVLLLRRSHQVRSFPGRWAGVSGRIESPDPVRDAFRELREETGILEREVRSVSAGRPFRVRGGARIYLVHPFRMEHLGGPVRLNWEHTASEWVWPSELRSRWTVPQLRTAWRSVPTSRAPSPRRNENR